MAVTGPAGPQQLLRHDAGRAGLPPTPAKPIGSGLLNNRHKSTGEVFAAAVETMTALNREASRAALAAAARAATDVTGFGLLGHPHKMIRASGVGAVLAQAAVPLIEGAAEALRDGYISGGTRKNLGWVREHLRPASTISEEDLLVLADSQNSSGQLVDGECAGYSGYGEVVEW